MSIIAALIIEAQFRQRIETQLNERLRQKKLAIPVERFNIMVDLAIAELAEEMFDTLLADKLQKVSNAIERAINGFTKKQTHSVRSVVDEIESMNGSDIRLLFGEMTAQEMRTTKAVLAWCARKFEPLVK